jgi:hypothetical protein
MMRIERAVSFLTPDLLAVITFKHTHARSLREDARLPHQQLLLLLLLLGRIASYENQSEGSFHHAFLTADVILRSVASDERSFRP